MSEISEHERIRVLETTVPELAANVRDVLLRLDGLAVGGASVAAPGLALPRSVILYDPVLTGGLGGALVSVSTYEGFAGQFGLAKAEAEDMVDDIEDDIQEFIARVVNVQGQFGSDVRDPLKKNAQDIADALGKALSKAREARAKAKAAATAAKMLGATNPKIDDARKSFREARDLLRDFVRRKMEAVSKDEVRDLSTMLSNARDKIDEDLAHLNEAMAQVK